MQRGRHCIDDPARRGGHRAQRFANEPTTGWQHGNGSKKESGEFHGVGRDHTLNPKESQTPKNPNSASRISIQRSVAVLISGFGIRHSRQNGGPMPPDPPRFRRRALILAASGWILPGCRKKPVPAAPPPRRLLTPGASPPEWSRLDPWQAKVTHEQFLTLINEVLTDGRLWSRHVEVTNGAAFIRMATPVEGSTEASSPRYQLNFAPSSAGDPAPALRYWRRPEEMSAVRDPARPLEGMHIALDPGHIGGFWAQMEERYSKPGDKPAVLEGDITLRTAKTLAPMLGKLGARVSLVRKDLSPLTPLRPEQLMDEARASLEQSGQTATADAVKHEAERLFYRSSEIRARGALVNDTLRPDLVVCLHYNGDVKSGVFSTANHLHVLAHGCIGDDEFRLDDQRLEGLLRLVQRVPDVEIPLCTTVAHHMAEATGLPAYTYHGSNARMVPGEPYVWMRNLLANRIYQCPVVFLEPYVMTNIEVIDRLTAGDYEGTANIAGKERPSIFREYAGGVAAGLSDFYLTRRRT
jgi:N-acetylmuramoyl-L-alanine amidase